MNIHDVIITEGVFDVILSHKYKVQNVIATLGTSFTQEHVDKIKKYNKLLYFVLMPTMLDKKLL